MADITPGPGWWKATDGEWYPPRWEYQWVEGRIYKPDSKTKPQHRDPEVKQLLAELGAQGWEAVTALGEPVTMDNAPVSVLMKRPIRP